MLLASSLNLKYKPKDAIARRVEVPYKSFFTYPLIYRMLRTGSAATWPNLFQFVQFLNKFMFQIIVLPWLMLKYKYVIFDRWALSAVIYGDAGNASPRFNRFLYSMLKKPDATIVLVGNARGECNEDVYERNKIMQTLVRIGYYDWANKNVNDAVKVDAAGEKATIHTHIINALVEKGIVQ